MEKFVILYPTFVYYSEHIHIISMKTIPHSQNSSIFHSGAMIVWLFDLQLPMQSVPIITNVVSSNLAHGEVYLIQHYVIKFVGDFRQVSGFLWVPPPIKLTVTI